ncbi:Nucleotide-binding, alpha-beta plait [Quillaja saponaria]|uniref:Nucleotide-binding, alpha-beta plait n=1 Tax=Quillaja saponaria TaxID=32244 RepID=A0AAD7Q637_QUISA|nr:Nucleotide-binding, alpha-beta plait [Quillaja saponaria]
MRVVRESESAHAGKSKQINTISTISEGCWAGLPSKQQRRNNKRKRAPSEKNLQGKETSHAFGKRRSFKPRGNLHGSQSSAFRNKGNKSCYIAGPALDADFVRYRSEQHRSDLEPHAGYLEPIAGFVERHHTRYLEPAVSNHSHSLQKILGTCIGKRKPSTCRIC